MRKQTTLDSFMKRRDDSSSNTIPIPRTECASKRQRIEPQQMDATSIERDPCLRPQISEFPFHQRDEIRRAYLKAGPFQPILSEYPFSGKDNHRRRFQPSWFNTYSDWLEYSIEKDAIFCLPCYLFKENGHQGPSAFPDEGFKNWKKVKEGVNCPLLCHVGKEVNSAHKKNVKSCENRKKQSQHIDKLLQKQTSKDMEDSQLRLKASIDCVRWLTFQACAFRGNDESINSKNRGNFIEMLKFVGTYNEKLGSVLLENSSKKNATYTSPLSGKSKTYSLIDRLIRLVLTLPVSTTSTERAFSAMKLVKTRLRNKMDDGFLADNLVVYIEKDIAKTFSTEMIMEDFYSMKTRRGCAK